MTGAHCIGIRRSIRKNKAEGEIAAIENLKEIK